MKFPTFTDVVSAANRLKEYEVGTPVFTSRTADALLGAETFFKCENLQKTGAFKFRGALNALLQLDDACRKKGVIAFSTGNHAQAVALAARLLDMPAVIVMPHDASRAKVAATKSYGAEVLFYDRFRDDREMMCEGLVQQRGLTLIPPFDHADIIAGQGTATMELFEEVGPLDYLFAPVGGGGLLAGSLLVAKKMSPTCRVIGVEPQAANDAQMSLSAGKLMRIAPPVTIADGAQAQQLGALPFEIMRRDVHDIITASDADLVQGLRFFAERMKLVVEPTGCLGFAGALHFSLPKGSRIGVILTGGNVDMTHFSEMLAAE